MMNDAGVEGKIGASGADESLHIYISASGETYMLKSRECTRQSLGAPHKDLESIQAWHVFVNASHKKSFEVRHQDLEQELE